MAKIIVVPDDGIPEETKVRLREQLETGACRFCGGLHEGTCPRIKHIIFHPTDDTVMREVEFWADGEWDKSRVIFADDVI